MTNVEMYITVRRRDMLNSSCLACGSNAVRETLDNRVKCGECGYVVPRWLTKAELITYLPEETDEAPIESIEREVETLDGCYREKRRNENKLSQG